MRVHKLTVLRNGKHESIMCETTRIPSFYVREEKRRKQCVILLPLFIEDSLAPKHFSPSNRNLNLHIMLVRRACYVDSFLLNTPYKIILKQNNLRGLRFNRGDMSISHETNDTLIGLLIKSVKYN